MLWLGLVRSVRVVWWHCGPCGIGGGGQGGDGSCGDAQGERCIERRKKKGSERVVVINVFWLLLMIQLGFGNQFVRVFLCSVDACIW